ncbi:hypothetical protein AAG570_002346 [Ranatra chinensis]|uniref:UPAR/Ly6 domain-containing protein qvr n=1 Tax=Ranatra chinensis TaxID=642074 RepID=A0ABD0Y7A6_9HEMI
MPRSSIHAGVLRIFSRRESLKCFACDTTINKNCADPFNTSMKAIECGPLTIGPLGFASGASGLLDNMASMIGDLARSTGSKTGDPKTDLTSNIASATGIDLKNLNLPDMEFACYKYTYEVSGAQGAARMCFPKGTPCDKLQKEAESAGGKMGYCGFCEDDLCNSAVSPAGAMALLLLPLFALLLNRD